MNPPLLTTTVNHHCLPLFSPNPGIGTHVGSAIPKKPGELCMAGGCPGSVSARVVYGGVGTRGMGCGHMVRTLGCPRGMGPGVLYSGKSLQNWLWDLYSGKSLQNWLWGPGYSGNHCRLAVGTRLQWESLQIWLSEGCHSGNHCRIGCQKGATRETRGR